MRYGEHYENTFGRIILLLLLLLLQFFIVRVVCDASGLKLIMKRHRLPCGAFLFEEGKYHDRCNETECQ